MKLSQNIFPPKFLHPKKFTKYTENATRIENPTKSRPPHSYPTAFCHYLKYWNKKLKKNPQQIKAIKIKNYWIISNLFFSLSDLNGFWVFFSKIDFKLELGENWKNSSSRQKWFPIIKVTWSEERKMEKLCCCIHSVDSTRLFRDLAIFENSSKMIKPFDSFLLKMQMISICLLVFLLLQNIAIAAWNRCISIHLSA